MANIIEITDYKLSIGQGNKYLGIYIGRVELGATNIIIFLFAIYDNALACAYQVV